MNTGERWGNFTFVENILVRVYGYQNLVWYLRVWKGPPSCQWYNQPYPTQSRNINVHGHQPPTTAAENDGKKMGRRSRTRVSALGGKARRNLRCYRDNTYFLNLLSYIHRIPTFDGKASTWSTFINIFEL